jgi:hypothetical protein
MNQSREAHYPARPLHSPEGAYSPDPPRPFMKRPGDPFVAAMIQPSGPPESHARVGVTLPPAASVGTGLISREVRDVLSYRYATRPDSGHTGCSTTKIAAQHGY